MTKLEHDVLKDQVELWKDAREFIHTMVFLHGHDGLIEQARILCGRLTTTIVGIGERIGEEDDFKFEPEETK